jgi:hypothetical protein
MTANVPDKPVIWKAVYKDKTRLIKARLWFDACRKAAIKFQCHPDELTVERL